MNTPTPFLMVAWGAGAILSTAGALLGFLLVTALVLSRLIKGPEDTRLIAFLRLFNSLYTRFWHGLRPGREDPLPASGAAILIANHRSGLDPVVLAAHTKRIVRFLMAREYYEICWLRWFFDLVGAIPVNRDGNDVAATKKALKALKEGQVIGIFPEGGIRLAGPDGAQEDFIKQEEFFKAGAALLALKTGVPVIPAFIEGTPPKDSVLQAFLIPSRSRVTFGTPLQLPAPQGRSPSKEELRAAAQEIYRSIEALKK
ncbi:MAG: 1-acyl-sn-glycerol-3-phosphate acyltransferase [Planctomycetes bacterium]|nr:1-acyl-sn-glycerol-3-phosphate acyltransferase [Planctomycetota bacterium]